jgi:hypothetical protein
MKFRLPSFPNIPARFQPRQLNLVYLRQSWWKLLALSILIAIFFSLLPGTYCALADCGVKDKWCNGDCSQTCGPTNGLGVVVGCSRGAYGCIDDWIPDAWGMNCTNSNDCKVTDCASTPPGYGCYLVADGRWDVGACSAYPSCSRVSRVINETCCLSGGPAPCPKSGPKITTAALQPTPEYPLVIGQDPDDRGVTISSITATAGEHDCRTGTISAISVSIRLSSASVSWINGELARKYPGAHVLGTYPISPVLTTTGLNTATATTSFHFNPLDPGDYEVTVTVTQDDGQTAVKVFTVHVALYESTITH